MLWLFVAVLSYLILAVVFLIDKLLLSGPIPSPKVYTFYIGALGILTLFAAPFVGFHIPSPFQLFLSFSAGAFFVLGLFWFYKGLQLFEPSRIVPAIGGILPLFTFLLIYIFSKGEEALSLSGFFAFALLIIGSILIAYEKSKISLKSLKISIIAAFLFAAYFVLSKYVYLAQPFWSGYIWIKIGSFLSAFCILLFSSEVKREIFKKKKPLPQKPGLFIFNQLLGGGANILQNWSVALAPLAFVAIINALAGIQYAFLLVLTIGISFAVPVWAEKVGLKEKISKSIFVQKIIAILVIGMGLALLAL